MMSRSCPFHSFQLPLHVPDIFSVCPLHFPCRADWFPCALFPFHSPCTPLVFISHFCPLCLFPFPAMSTSHFLPSFPCTHSPLHPSISRKITRFFQRFQFFQMFGKKGGRKLKPAKEPARGIKSGTPVLRHRLPEDYV